LRRRSQGGLAIEEAMQTGVAFKQVTPDAGPFSRVQIVERKTLDIALKDMYGHS
jgi:hypothetical protein